MTMIGPPASARSFLRNSIKTRAIHSTFEALKFHIATRTDGADQLQAKAIAPVGHLGRLSDFAPRRAAMGVGAHHRLIDKVYRRAGALGLRLQPGKGLL